MLLVLGRPGSGCSTFLKTLSGDTHGFHVNTKAVGYSGTLTFHVDLLRGFRLTLPRGPIRDNAWRVQG
jgi:ABC-type multidrug transport system ATPase subunit